MVAVPEGGSSAPAVEPVGDSPAAAAPVRERRVVAVAVDATELLRPESDLVRLVEGARYVDVLLASEVGPVADPAPLGVLAGADVLPGFLGAVADDADDDEDDPADALLADVARLGVPELHVHRLDLRGVVGTAAEDDLVAALSELVGFDPEPGVYLLAPAGAGPGRPAVQRAVARVAQVYGIPVLRYRCLELVVVDPAG